jgi:hypothetical protein
LEQAVQVQPLTAVQEQIQFSAALHHQAAVAAVSLMEPQATAALVVVVAIHDLVVLVLLVATMAVLVELLAVDIQLAAVAAALVRSVQMLDKIHNYLQVMAEQVYLLIIADHLYFTQAAVAAE